MTEQSVNTRERESRIRGMVYGLALGDALGYPVEFENAPAVTGISGTLIISDDTQMSLHNVAALQQIVRAYGHKLRSPRLDTGFHNAARRAFLDEYVLFGTSEHNNRAPGNACMSSINNYRKNPAIAGGTTVRPGNGNSAEHTPIRNYTRAYARRSLSRVFHQPYTSYPERAAGAAGTDFYGRHHYLR